MMNNRKVEGGWHTGDNTQAPLAVKLKQDFPDVKYATRRAFGGDQLFNTGSKSIYQESIYVDPDFFNIFTFPAISGDPVTALKEPDAAVLTESAAERLFGKANPMGRIIRQNSQHSLRVAAVIRDAPASSTIRFDIVLPFRLYEIENASWIDRWDNYRLSSIVMLQPEASVEHFNQKLLPVMKSYGGDSTNYVFAYNLRDLHMYGSFKNGKPNGGRIELMWLLGLTAFFILLIACINFMNLTTAQSERRAREVGMRKVMGASRRIIIIQFLAEALLITMLAMLLGIFLAWLCIPGLNRISGRSISFGLLNWKMWCGLLSLLVATGLIAGSYPAFFLSGFQPVKVLKGGLVSGGKGRGRFRKALVTLQFVISIFLILTTIVIYRQIRYVETRPIGYEQNNLLEIPARGEMAQHYPLLRDALAQVSGVESVSAGTDNLLRFGGSTDDVVWPGKTRDQNFPVTITWVQYDWALTAGMQLLAGRDFSSSYGSDSIGCIVNEAAVRRMGLKEPVVGTLLGSNPIIGVVRDFVMNDPFNAAPPMVLYFGNGSMDHIFIRLRPAADQVKTLSSIAAVLKDKYPEFPFEYHFLKDSYQQQFSKPKSVRFVLNWTSSLAIIISCLGLFGLSAFLTERRSKEISIRKIMGATTGSIWLMLAREFLQPVFIAFVVTIPLVILVMRQALHNIDYRIELHWWIFATGGLITAVIALATISYQGAKAARANPVKALQSE
jgi:ABC-type antimicrobial peptide transport system permease subunit